jgi:hypothetical protein
MDAGYVAALSGLVGALIGSASSIAAMFIQGRMKDERDRSKQLTDMALAEFKLHLDLPASGKDPSAIAPPVAFPYHNELVLNAIENGSYNPQKAKEISVLVDEMYDALNEIEKRRGTWDRADAARGSAVIAR